ncbi:hypothetical protein PENTCL1PPCAC_26449 [Pristionchus entomophagus]|uniref:Uncharacterized protein n=1 Tax=Pristionchus entomophagus TaxID=358040 RepID=A0AAV5UDR0_9BILA|nr:hypothetical protein PENTCL1PPCAC_26449 [Pristionchus entomophagus]
MGDKTPESKMDEYFERLRTDHSPSILARSGRTAHCKPRSRLSRNGAGVESKKRLIFEDDAVDAGEKRKRRIVSQPIEVIDISSSSQSADEDIPVTTNQCLEKVDQHKRRRSLSLNEDSMEAKKPLSDVEVAGRSPLMVVPFGDENGNNCMVRPETRRTFAGFRGHIDEESRMESIQRARRIREMELFQQEVLNSGDEWQDYQSEVDTDLEEDLFDGLNHLHMD